MSPVAFTDLNHSFKADVYISNHQLGVSSEKKTDDLKTYVK